MGVREQRVGKQRDDGSSPGLRNAVASMIVLGFAVGLGRAFRQVIKSRHRALRDNDLDRLLASRPPLNRDDEVWGLVGAFETAGPTDLSENVHRYATQPNHEETRPTP